MAQQRERPTPELTGFADERDRPRHEGDRYCSPRCGFGCKRKAYERAVAEGNALAASLGAGWRAEVWENWGWHYQAANGRHVVSPVMEFGGYVDGTWRVAQYYAVLDAGVQTQATFKTPLEALQDALRKTRNRMEGDLATLRRLTPTPIELPHDPATGFSCCDDPSNLVSIGAEGLFACSVCGTIQRPQ